MEYKGELAIAYTDLAKLLRDAHDAPDTRKLNEKALAILSKLASEHPDDMSRQTELANSLRGFGDLLSSLGETSEAQEQYQQAIAVMSKIVTTSREKFGGNNRFTVSSALSLAKTFKAAKKPNEAVQLCLEYGLYSDALRCVLPGDTEILRVIFKSANEQNVEKLPTPVDALVVGELRLVSGDARSAEPAMRAAIEKSAKPAYMFKSLGWCLLGQAKSDEARVAFQQVLKKFLQPDGTYKLDKPDPDELTAAYFLDLVSEGNYIEGLQTDKKLACFPWFYVAQRREIEGKKDAAIKAYERCVELGTGDNPHTVRALAEWRLQKLKVVATTGRKKWLKKLASCGVNALSHVLRHLALHKKFVGAVADRDSGLPHLPTYKVALNRRRRRLPQNDFFCKAGGKE